MAEKKALRKNMTIAEAIKLKPPIAGLLMSKGMHCLGCSVAAGETIEQAAQVHGLDPNVLIKEINDLKV